MLEIDSLSVKMIFPGHQLQPVVVLMLILGSTSAQSQSSSEIPRQPENYDKTQPPYKDKATEVKVGFHILSMSIDDANMEMEVSFYFRQAWLDPRLKFGRNARVRNVRLFDSNQIWKPDTFFRNDVKDSLHSVPAGSQLVKLDEAGNVWFVQKVTAKFACPLNFNKYPADIQLCHITVESFGYTTNTMYFSTLSMDVDDKLQNPPYRLVTKLIYDCSQNYTTGSYPCLEFRFMFERDTGFFMKRIYMPTSAIVLLSTSAFWLPADHPGRVPVALLTTLTMTLYAVVAGIYYPPIPISYVTRLDVWLGGCVLIVFAAFVVQLVGVIAAKKQEDAPAGEKSVRERLFGSKIDLVGTILFPAVFLVFSIFYACLWT